MTIEVHGLTVEQSKMMDKLWSLETVEKIYEFLDTLSDDEALEALTLVELAKMAAEDIAAIENDPDCSLAKKILEKVLDK